MSRLEHALASLVLRILGLAFDLLPIRKRVVLATARIARLDGNLAFLHAELRRTRPRLEEGASGSGRPHRSSSSTDWPLPTRSRRPRYGNAGSRSMIPREQCTR